jgi:hypothetical protein
MSGGWDAAKTRRGCIIKYATHAHLISPLHLTGCINNAISVECITASCLRLHFLSGAGLKGLLMERHGDDVEMGPGGGI